MATKIKPTKTHYNRYMKAWRAAWIFDISEKVASVRKSDFDESVAANSFEPHYPRQLALNYGIKNGFIKAIPSIERPKEYDVYFTDKGMKDNTHRQMTTCAFTGRTVRGGAF